MKNTIETQIKKYFLLIDKTKINIIWEVLQKYPIDNIHFITINENCIELESCLNFDILQDDIRYYFYQIGYYHTFSILCDILHEYEII